MSKLIIFDCDGTLVDSEVIAAEIFPDVWASVGVSVTKEYFLNNFIGAHGDAEVVKQTMNQLSAHVQKMAEEKFHDEINKRLKAVVGIPELLGSLSFSTCVASNSRLSYVKNCIALTNLSKYFGENLFSAEQVANPKPSPDLFLHAAKTMGFSSKDCLVIEDSPTGIQAAKAASMKVIGFMGGQHFTEALKERLKGAQADVYASTALELAELIRKK